MARYNYHEDEKNTDVQSVFDEMDNENIYRAILKALDERKIYYRNYWSMIVIPSRNVIIYSDMSICRINEHGVKLKKELGLGKTILTEITKG